MIGDHSEKSWKFFYRSSDAWQAMLRDVERATKTIVFEQYIFADFEPGQIGRLFVDSFKRKALEGVSVRLFIDGAGSFDFAKSEVVNELRESGVGVKFHKIVRRWRTKHPMSFFMRDHRKLLVVDREVSYVGGVCIEEEQRNWRDTFVRFTDGKLASYFTEAFDAMWKREVDDRKIFKYSRHTHEGFAVVTNSPRFMGRFIYLRLLGAMHRSKKFIHITTPYFVPDRRFKRAVARAIKRGVSVKILLPETSDIRFMDVVARSYFDRLLRLGAEIYLYKDSVLHAKTVVVDEGWSTVGSLNMDRLSFWFNHELNVVSENESFNDEVSAGFLEDIKRSERLSLSAWRERGWWERCLEVLAVIARPFA